MRNSNLWLRSKEPTLTILALDVVSFKTLKVKNPFLCLCCVCTGHPWRAEDSFGSQFLISTMWTERRLSNLAASTAARRAVSPTQFCIFLISFMLSVLQNPLSEALVCSSSLSLKIGCWEIEDPGDKMSPTLCVPLLLPC